MTEKMKLPYLHRLAAATGGVHPVLLASTLCATKTDVDDWSQPGGIYRINTFDSGPDSWQKIPVMEGLHRNHGFSLTKLDGSRIALASGIEGLFSIALPGRKRAAWSCEQILAHDVSDAVLLDWNNDGREELVTIEPFHGSSFVFYERNQGEAWRAVHEIPCLLGHSLWAGEALGRKTIILGERQGAGRVQLVFPNGNNPRSWETVEVARDTGGTNVAVLRATDRALEFVSANNDPNQVVLYRVAP